VSAAFAGTDAGTETRRDEAAVTVFVCTSCRRPLVEGDDEAGYGFPGLALHAGLAERLAGEPRIRVEAVDCLAVCKRAATVALAGPGLWTYVVGDLDPDTDLDDTAAMARAFLASGTGIVAWRERPQPFRKGVIARLPPVLPPLLPPAAPASRAVPAAAPAPEKVT